MRDGIGIAFLAFCLIALSVKDPAYILHTIKYNLYYGHFPN